MYMTSMKKSKPYSTYNNSFSQSNYTNNSNFQRSAYLNNSFNKKYHSFYTNSQTLPKYSQQNEISFLTRHHESYKPPENRFQITYQLYEKKPSQKLTQFQKYLSTNSKYSKQYRNKLNSFQSVDIQIITENPFQRKNLIPGIQDNNSIKQAIEQIVNGSYLPAQSRVKIAQTQRMLQPPTLLRMFSGKLEHNLSFKADQLQDSSKNLSFQKRDSQNKVKQQSFTQPVTKRQIQKDQKKNIYKQKARGVENRQKWESPQRIRVKGKQYFISSLGSLK